MATLTEYFETDFTTVLNAASSIRVAHPDWQGEVRARVHYDFDANAKFLSVYLPDVAATEGICLALFEEVSELLKIGDGVDVSMSYFKGDTPAMASELHFAGRVFIYHERPIDPATTKRLVSAAKERGVWPRLRGPEYASARGSVETPLAFISHDSRDKADIARPIAQALVRQMCPVWYDEFSLNVGDQLRQSIERGLREARKCILIVTPHFIGNTGWTKTEFDAVFTRELMERKDVVLPVWHGVSAGDVYSYSPSLANRYALQWSLGETEVVRQLRRAIDAA